MWAGMVVIDLHVLTGREGGRRRGRERCRWGGTVRGEDARGKTAVVLGQRRRWDWRNEASRLVIMPALGCHACSRFVATCRWFVATSSAGFTTSVGSSFTATAWSVLPT